MPTPTDRAAVLARLRAHLALEPGSTPPSHDDLRVLMTASHGESDFTAEGALRVLQMRVAKLQQLETDIAYMRRHFPTAAEVCDAVGAYWRELGLEPEPWSLSDVLMHAARAYHAADFWQNQLEVLTGILGVGFGERITAAQRLVDEHRRLTAENERLRAELAELRAQFAPPMAPMPAYLQPESPEMACPSCGGRVHWGGIGDDGLGYAYCARSDRACTRKDQPEIGDGACAWTGHVRRLRDRVVVAR